MATVYEIVTGRIIEMLEKGVVPWTKPAPRSSLRSGRTGGAESGQQNQQRHE
jgi:antirestriction protein ArdC